MRFYLRKITQEVKTWGSLVKFSHSIFALPFAVSMAVIVWKDFPVTGWQLLYILVAVVSARTAAMAFNRLLDRKIDARNPRTQSRELPRGVVSIGSVIGLLLLSSFIFLGAASLLGAHCAILAPVVLALLLFYSWSKRFTSLSHLILGLSLGCAPGGVWYALRGTVALEPVLLMCGVTLWVAGFDILYACQDEAFDRAQGLHSIPASIGVDKALKLSFILHLISLTAFGGFALSVGLGPLFYLGFIIFSYAIIGQHRLVSAGDLSRINAAFFTRNGLASVIFLLAVVLDVMVATP
jgi:4-hydroxybenzoate polyprenyltransferase